MQRRSRTLQTRLEDVQRRLRAMRTVTNTASAEIAGGETVIDVDGSVYFLDGGRLVLGSSSINTSEDKPIIDAQGNLSVDSLTVYGDVLSAKDYLLQRETFEQEVIDTDSVESVSSQLVLEFPDWSSSALVTYYIYLNTRIATTSSNRALVKINGKPVARPRADELGNVRLSTTVVRRMLPGTPEARIDVEIEDVVLPTSDPRLTISAGGVFSA